MGLLFFCLSDLVGSSYTILGHVLQTNACACVKERVLTSIDMAVGWMLACVERSDPHEENHFVHRFVHDNGLLIGRRVG